MAFKINTFLGTCLLAMIITDSASAQAPQTIKINRAPTVCEDETVVVATGPKSLDGRYAYHVVCHWQTSSEVLRIRLSDGRVSAVTDGNSVWVVQSGRYRGYLIVDRHTYTPNGAQDSYWAVRPDGRRKIKIPNSNENEAAVATWLARHSR
jgi:hypothetical protein